jgi:protein dithiol oxidoreductase (disulfide-forming)
MRRRSVLTLGALACLPLSLSAQSAAPESGFDYRIISSPVAMPSGKIEVSEFFWYGCPHCHDLEPGLQKWLKNQKSDVIFKRYPIAFREELLVHSRLYLAFEHLGVLNKMHEKTFEAMHIQHKRLSNENEIIDWVVSQGLDRASFEAAFKSFAIVTKARASNDLGKKVMLDGVPTLMVQGKYLTSPSIVGGDKARSLMVLDYLVDQIRNRKL